MRRWLVGGCLVGILALTAVLRMTGIDWDDYHHFHPDERYITWVATTIERPSSLITAFSPHQSTINPYYWPPDAASEGILVLQDEARDFAYGHLPLYLGVAATRLAERAGPALAARLPDDWRLAQDVLNGSEQIEFRHLTAVSRFLTALFDVGTVLMIFLLGWRVYNAETGLLAAGLLAVNVMHIQLSHFFTFDPYMTFFVVTAVFFMALAYQSAETDRSGGFSRKVPAKASTPRVGVYLILAVISAGLAVGSKFAAILLALPLALTVWLTVERRWTWLGTAVFAAALTFFITNPFAALDLTCEVISPAMQIGPISIPALDWRSCFLDNILTQGAMVRGDIDLPFTRQYIGTTPFLYYIEMQLKWGMGPLLGLAACAGFVWAISRFRISDFGFRNRHRQSAIRNPQSAIILAWCVPYFLFTGSFHVKFMRYMQPLTPFLMLFAAAMIVHLPWRKGRWVAGTAVFLTTTLYAVAFVNMYRQPHPWVTASEWVYVNVPPGTLILSEQWDDPLPISLMVDGEWRQRTEYDNAELTWLTRADARDTNESLMDNLTLLAEADYLAIMSNRVYGVVPGLPDKFPLSSQYHHLLFNGDLGYEPVFITDRRPELFGVSLYADTFDEVQPPADAAVFLDARPHLTLGRADESFTVYDQPLTIIFKNNGHLTVDEMRQQFVP